MEEPRRPPRILVLGADPPRAQLAASLEALGGLEVVDCDPAAGDCVMYVRLEAARYDAFLFAGFDDPVSRGALAHVAQRAALIPLVDDDAVIDPRVDGYLFRLPRSLGMRDAAERLRVIDRFPQAAAVPAELVGPACDDPAGLGRLLRHAVDRERWQWAEFVDRVEREEARDSP